MILELLGIVVGIVFIVISFAGGEGLYLISNLIDLPSLLAILILTIPVLFRNGMWKDFFRGFKILGKKYECHLSELKRTLDAVEMMQKQVLYAGLLITVIELVELLVISVSSGLTSEILLVNIAIIILPVVYLCILELFLLPMQLEAKKRIIDYIGE